MYHSDFNLSFPRAGKRRTEMLLTMEEVMMTLSTMEEVMMTGQSRSQ
jgi:hypothetical protein